MPDIDIDFEDTRREKVIQYVQEKYGELHVSGIVTFGHLLARAVARDVGRIMGFDEVTLNKLELHLMKHIKLTILKSLYIETIDMNAGSVFVKVRRFTKTYIYTCGRNIINDHPLYEYAFNERGYRIINAMDND